MTGLLLTKQKSVHYLTARDCSNTPYTNLLLLSNAQSAMDILQLFRGVKADVPENKLSAYCNMFWSHVDLALQTSARKNT